MYAQVSAAVLGIRADLRRLAQRHGPGRRRDSRSPREGRSRHRHRAAVPVRSRRGERGRRRSDRGRWTTGTAGRQRRRSRQPVTKAAQADRQTAASEHAERRGTELAEKDDGGGNVDGGTTGRGGASQERHREARDQNIPETIGQGEGRCRWCGPVQPD